MKRGVVRKLSLLTAHSSFFPLLTFFRLTVSSALSRRQRKTIKLKDIVLAAAIAVGARAGGQHQAATTVAN